MLAEEEIGYGTVIQVKWDAQSMRYSEAGGLSVFMPQSFEDSFQFAVLDRQDASTVKDIAREKMPPWAKDNAKLEESYKSCKRVSPSWA